MRALLFAFLVSFLTAETAVGKVEELKANHVEIAPVVPVKKANHELTNAEWWVEERKLRAKMTWPAKQRRAQSDEVQQRRKLIKAGKDKPTAGLRRKKAENIFKHATRKLSTREMKKLATKRGGHRFKKKGTRKLKKGKKHAKTKWRKNQRAKELLPSRRGSMYLKQRKLDAPKKTVQKDHRWHRRLGQKKTKRSRKMNKAQKERFMKLVTNTPAEQRKANKEKNKAKNRNLANVNMVKPEKNKDPKERRQRGRKAFRNQRSAKRRAMRAQGKASKVNKAGTLHVKPMVSPEL